jgi:hypothetical protein
MGKVIDYATPIGWAGDIYSAATGNANPVNSVINSVTGALGPASTAGVQGAATDAQNIQNTFLGQYNALQPNQAPTMSAVGMKAAQSNPASAIQASQFGPATANAASVNTAGLQPWTQGQGSLAASLQNTITNPNASSVAQIQQQQAFAQQMAQQQGLAAAMGRGGNAALAARTAMNNVGGLGAQQAAASALQRANEVASAQGQLGNVLQQGAGNALQVGGQNTANQQQTNLSNQAAAMAALSQNAQQQQAASQFNASNQQQTALANQAAQQAAASQNAQQAQAANAANQTAQVTTTGQNIAQQNNLGQLTNTANANQVNAQVGALNAQTAAKAQLGNLISTGGAAILSDERVKENIHDVPGDVMRDFLASLQPQSWRYRGDDQPRVGPMAQDIEKSPIGRTLVRETPIGKAIDHGAAITAMLGALGDVGKRIAALESARKAA